MTLFMVNDYWKVLFGQIKYLTWTKGKFSDYPRVHVLFYLSIISL